VHRHYCQGLTSPLACAGRHFCQVLTSAIGLGWACPAAWSCLVLTSAICLGFADTVMWPSRKPPKAMAPLPGAAPQLRPSRRPPRCPGWSHAKLCSFRMRRVAKNLHSGKKGGGGGRREEGGGESVKLEGPRQGGESVKLKGPEAGREREARRHRGRERA